MTSGELEARSWTKAGYAAAGAIVLLWVGSAAADIRFEERTQQSGIEHEGVSWGAAWGDMNRDGYPDVFVGNHADRDQIYINNTLGEFEDKSRVLDDRRGDTHAATWVDLDRDGDDDLMVVRGGGSGVGMGDSNHLFINDGARLVEQATEFGLDYPYARGRSPLWFDWNNDGYLDVLLVNVNKRAGPPQAPTKLFSFDPQARRFVPEEYVLYNKTWTRFAQLVVGNRLLPDSPVIVVQEFKYPDGIYSYGVEGFRPVKREFKFPPRVSGSGDIALGDFDNDLFVDFFTGGIRSGDSRLLLQSANGMVDSTVQSGLAGIDHAQSVVTADFDNDMDLDIYVARGFGRKLDVPNLPNVLYENLGGGVFRQVPGPVGVEGSTQGQSESATTVDYDNDGFIDIFLTNGQEKNIGPNQLFRNMGNGNNWLTVELVGEKSNIEGIGARVLATAGGITQVREEVGGIHRNSQNDRRLHFGLGDHSVVESLTVHWPSGLVQELNGLGTNEFITVTEGATLRAESPRLTPGDEQLSIDLTAAGDLDWAQWGAVRSERPRKSGVQARIGDIDATPGGKRMQVDNIEFLWTDGPDGMENATGKMIRYRGAGSVVSFAVSAGGIVRRLRVYAQVRHSRVRFEAKMDGGNALEPVVQTVDMPDGDVNVVLTYDFSSGNDAGVLKFHAVVEDTYGKPWGNVALGAATLSGEGR